MAKTTVYHCPSTLSAITQVFSDQTSRFFKRNVLQPICYNQWNLKICSLWEIVRYIQVIIICTIHKWGKCWTVYCSIRFSRLSFESDTTLLVKMGIPPPSRPDFTTRVSCAHRQNYLFAWPKCRIIYFLENK